MAEQKFCQGCIQRHDCQEVYRRLGKAQCSSVVSKTIVAFVMPIVVFIAVLAAFEALLAKSNAKSFETLISFLLALGVTYICILIVKAINTRLSKIR